MKLFGRQRQRLTEHQNGNYENTYLDIKNNRTHFYNSDNTFVSWIFYISDSGRN